MAGSYNHIIDKQGAFTGVEGRLLDNFGDAHEALEEMYGMIWFLAGGDADAVERARQNYRAGLALSPGGTNEAGSVKTMKLYLLEARENARGHYERHGPWDPPEDKAYGFVIRAENEARARELASEEHGREGAPAWLDPLLTSCEVLDSDGDEEIVIVNFYSG